MNHQSEAHKSEDLRLYRKYGMTLLQLMAILGGLGIVVTVVLMLFA